MRMIATLSFIALALLLTPHNAKADSDLFSVSAGYYDANDNEEAVDFRLEYRWSDPLVWVVKPWVGAEATSEGAAYGVAGLLFDFKLAERFLITPSFGVGAYADGSGKDLGHTLEFRSQLELGYEFDNESRVGIAGGHISNAGIGDSNPGTEIISLYYHHPVDWF